MPILTLNDAPVYSPGISLDNIAFVEALFLRTQALAESPLGANRSLELQTYTEIRDLPIASARAEFNLYNAPVILTPPPVLQVRLGVNQWSNMNESSYEVFSNGRVTIAMLLQGSFRFEIGSAMPGRFLSTQVRANYQSGFDFTQDTVADVVMIKSVVGKLAQMLYLAEGGGNQLTPSSYAQSQIEEFDADNDARVKVSPSAAKYTTMAMAAEGKLNTAIANILYPLKRYAPAPALAT